MYLKYKIVHAIPGRVRLSIPILEKVRDHDSIKEMFESITGIEHVRITPEINAMIIVYNSRKLDKRIILKDIGLFFSQLEDDQLPIDLDRQKMLGAIVKSVISGILILVAFLRRNGRLTPNLFDYLVVISTSYTVLSHGENRLSHPDVLMGIISIISLGAQNILSASLIAWFVNLIEVIIEVRNGLKNGAFAL